MFKKTLATALLAAAVPAVASASWFLSTQAMNAGGTIDTRNKAGQTVGDNAVFKQYTTSAGIPVTVTAATGYTIKSVTVNGVTANAPASPYSTTMAGSSTKDKSVSAVFVVNGVSLSASMTNGTVTPAAVGNLTYGYDLKDPLVFTFSPKAGYKLTGITGVPGADPNGKTPTTSAVPTAANQKMTVTFPKGYVFASATPITMAGTAVNTVIGLNPILPQTVVINKPATLTAVANDNLAAVAGGVTYQWNFVSGPANRVSATQGGTIDPVTGRLTSTTDIIPGPDVVMTPSATTPGEMTVSGLSVPGQYKFQVVATAGGKTYSYLTVVNAVKSALAGAYDTCQFCHSANNIGGTWNADNTVKQTSKQYIYDNWSSSVHHKYACYQCHRDANAGGHPGTVDCSGCHHGTDYAKTPYPQGRPVPVLGSEASCAHCHAADSQNIHAVTAAAVQAKTSCIGCHDVAAPQHKLASGSDGVGDNNGVRAIVGEFKKWSHHVTGVELNDAHCAACHMEGTVSNGAITIDPTYHMVDAKTHLRDTTAGTDADFGWDPMAPNQTGMDRFCMSCHDADGAVSAGSIAIQALINAAGSYNTGKTASAKNPFGDTISNRYDKMMRPAVTNVNDQFNTGNNSHHGVKGPRYSGRTRVAGDPRVIKAVNPDSAGYTAAAGFALNSSATLKGIRSTIYDAGNFNALYTPLSNAGGETAPRTGAASLGDDSTLHCGDCHTVGQWKAGSSFNADGTPTPVAIGAHGSNNEYMLRNSIGTDERHTQRAYLVGDGTVKNPFTGAVIPTGAIVYTNPNGALLVCFNCHNVDNYGQYMATGLNGNNAAGAQVNGRVMSHSGEYAEGGRCNGAGNTIPFNGYTTGVATNGTQFESRFEGPLSVYTTPAPYAGEVDPEFGNVFGIQCLNCHNSGIGNAYGGIHGSANNTSWNDGTTTINPASSVTGGAYIDGMGNTQKVERFLPGLGDVMHVPGILGGITGGTTAMSAGVPVGKYNPQIAPYPYTTGGISNDTNWEQKAWNQTATTDFVYTTGKVNSTAYTGAGCYTLGDAVDVNKAAVRNVAEGLAGPSVTGETGPATSLLGTWGGCDDHAGAQGTGNHGFVKRIVRPITY